MLKPGSLSLLDLFLARTWMRFSLVRVGLWRYESVGVSDAVKISL